MVGADDWNDRVRASEACVARFFGKPLDFKGNDCIRMGAFVANLRGWTVQKAKIGAYQSRTGALRAMRKMGFESLVDAMDAQGFPRIAPARAYPADLLALPSDDSFGAALYVRLTNGRVLGFKDGACSILKAHDYAAAWRL